MIPTSDASNVEPLSRLLKSLVDHYIQPVHSSSNFENEDLNDDLESYPSLAPFVAAVRQQVLQHEPVARNAAQSLLRMYKSHVRKALYAARPCQSKERRFTRLGIPVLCHYAQLIASLMNEIASDDLRQSEASFFECEASSDDESILCLANDITAIQSMHAMEEEEARENEEVRPDTSSIQRIMLRNFLRILCHKLRATESPTESKEALRRCFVSLLSFCAPTSYVGMDQDIVQRMFDLDAYVNFPSTQETIGIVASDEVWRIVSLNDSCAGSKIVESIDPISQKLGIDALVLLDRLVARQEPPQTRASPLIQVVQDDTVDELPHHLATCRRLIRSLGGDSCMASAVRAHFFGRDMLPEDEVVPVSRQRLHLAKTITETPKKEYKHYKFNPSRALVAISFVALTTTITQDSFDDLVPIMYELINDSTDKVRWGSVALFHLLKIAPEIWSENPIVCENLVQMLYREIQPMRDGPSLLLIGLAQSTLFHVMMNNNNQPSESSDNWIHDRRKATQQWLMILKQNNLSFTKNHLVLGTLYGGILPLLHEHANSPSLDGLELGRLGLQSLLTVLQQGLRTDMWMGNDDNESPLANNERALLRTAIHRGTLMALSNLFLAAHPIIGGHQGKILCTLVAFIRTTGVHGYTENHKLAEDVAAVALHMGQTNQQARDSVVQRIMGEYDKEVQRIMGTITDRSAGLAGT